MACRNTTEKGEVLVCTSQLVTEGFWGSLEPGRSTAALAATTGKSGPDCVLRRGEAPCPLYRTLSVAYPFRELPGRLVLTFTTPIHRPPRSTEARLEQMLWSYLLQGLLLEGHHGDEDGRVLNTMRFLEG